jgi:non-ribosomal peptide synthetase component F
VREAALGAYTHQDLPFDKLVSLVNPVRTLSYNPIFQVMLILQTAPDEALSLPGICVSPAAPRGETSICDLLLSLGPTSEGLAGYIEYDDDLFFESTIEKLVSSFEALLADVVTDPTRRLSKFLPGVALLSSLREPHDSGFSYPSPGRWAPEDARVSFSEGRR